MSITNRKPQPSRVRRKAKDQQLNAQVDMFAQRLAELLWRQIHWKDGDEPTDQRDLTSHPKKA
jgi:hypothetical protein